MNIKNVCLYAVSSTGFVLSWWFNYCIASRECGKILNNSGVGASRKYYIGFFDILSATISVKYILSLALMAWFLDPIMCPSKYLRE